MCLKCRSYLFRLLIICNALFTITATGGIQDGTMPQP